jgi:hypothetical protein
MTILLICSHLRYIKERRREKRRRRKKGIKNDKRKREEGREMS